MPIPPIETYPIPAVEDLPHRVDWTPDPARAVLLLHDMQHYFLAPYDLEHSPGSDLVANTAALRAACAAKGVPVFYTAQPGSMSSQQRGLLFDIWGPGMTADPADTGIVDAVKPDDGDVVFTKWRYSAFNRSDLLATLTDRGRDQLIVCGVYAHVGCLVTAIDAFSMDIQPFFVADAMADFSFDHHRQALGYAADRCARVLSTSDVLAALS